jgi:hypothetical protein
MASTPARKLRSMIKDWTPMLLRGLAEKAGLTFTDEEKKLFY